MSNDDRPALDELERKLQKARGARPSDDSKTLPTSGLSGAFRLTTEMVASLAVGGFGGWLLDGWLGTRPWLLLVFLVLGGAAGTLNAYRAAMRMARDASEAGRE